MKKLSTNLSFSTACAAIAFLVFASFGFGDSKSLKAAGVVFVAEMLFVTAIDRNRVTQPIQESDQECDLLNIQECGLLHISHVTPDMIRPGQLNMSAAKAIAEALGIEVFLYQGGWVGFSEEDSRADETIQWLEIDGELLTRLLSLEDAIGQE